MLVGFEMFLDGVVTLFSNVELENECFCCRSMSSQINLTFCGLKANFPFLGAGYSMNRVQIYTTFSKALPLHWLVV